MSPRPFIQLIRSGAMRDVLLLAGWAIKLPKVTKGWSVLRLGLEANRHERLYSRKGWPELCPVLITVLGGLILVMRRADPMPESVFESFDVMDFFCPHDGREIPGEPKPSSIGLLDGRPVVIDYGEGGN
jgi:hypothetical protein